MKEGAGAPLQVPGEAVSVCPSLGVPEMVGAEVLEGGTAATSAEIPEGAEDVVVLFVAVTTERTVWLTSALWRE